MTILESRCDHPVTASFCSHLQKKFAVANELRRVPWVIPMLPFTWRYLPGASGRLCGAEPRRYRKNSPIYRRHLPISRWELYCDAKKSPALSPGELGWQS